jgi:hypothetical protein
MRGIGETVSKTVLEGEARRLVGMTPRKNTAQNHISNAVFENDANAETGMHASGHVSFGHASFGHAVVSVHAKAGGFAAKLAKELHNLYRMA